MLLALPLGLLAAQRTQPNIIFILSDDLGYSDISPYGQKQIKTPHLQRLADEGILFTNAYSGAAVCGPSRAALFLGQHNGHNPIRHNPGAARGWDRTTQGDPPLPEMGRLSHVDAHTYWPDHLWRNDERVPLDGKTYSHDLFTKEALAYIRQQRDQPFLPYLAYTIPHVALDPPSLAPYENETWPEKEKAFAAMVTRMDTDIGKIAALLKGLKIDGDTLVIFARDNGPCTAGGHKASTFQSTPFRGESAGRGGRLLLEQCVLLCSRQLRKSAALLRPARALEFRQAIGKQLFLRVGHGRKPRGVHEWADGFCKPGTSHRLRRTLDNRMWLEPDPGRLTGSPPVRTFRG